MSARSLYLDEGPGEERGVATLGGRPERLLIHRVSTPSHYSPGARLAARVRRIDRSLATAFLDAGAEPDAVTPLTAALVEGARIEVEVVTPPREGKGAVVRVIGPTTGAPGLLSTAPSLTDQLMRFAPVQEIIRGAAARQAADLAEQEALAIVHRLPSGGAVAIEPTRALVAIDVDLGSASGDARRAASLANREAVAAAARLLRLKGLGGPVVFDLAGKGHDGEALRAEAEARFAPDQPGVAFGPITRFGLWTMILPRRAAPIAEILCNDEKTLSAETLALKLLRDIERQAGPGDRIEARAAPPVAIKAQSLANHLQHRIGARFRIVADNAIPADQPRLGPWEPGA